MKIIKLEAENIKKLRAVEIEPSGALVVIGGNNGEGKSSTLDAIEYALRGKRALADVPVRLGAKDARIHLTLDDYDITSKIKPDGGYTVTVKSRDGKEKFSSPQTLLDSLVGRIAFDPLEFATKEAMEQAATLKKIVGVDFTELEAKRQELYDKRTVAGRDVSGREKQIESMPHHPGAPTAERSAADLLEELSKLQTQKTADDEKRRTARDSQLKVENCATACLTVQAQIEEAEQAIEKWKAELERRKDRLEDARRTHEAAETAAQTVRNEIAALPDLAPKIETLTNDIAVLEETNKKVRDNLARAQLAQQLEEANSTYRELTAEIEAIDTQKANVLAAVQFPIDGLGFDENGVTYNGVPFKQTSSGEQLRVSVAIGLALNSELPVLLIRDGSLLDENNLRMIGEMAAAAGAQVWIERVGEGEECAVIIEDGLVKEDRRQKRNGVSA